MYLLCYSQEEGSSPNRGHPLLGWQGWTSPGALAGGGGYVEAGGFLFVLYHAAFAAAHLEKYLAEGAFQLHFVGGRGVVGFDELVVGDVEGSGELVGGGVGGVAVDAAQLFHRLFGAQQA